MGETVDKEVKKAEKEYRKREKKRVKKARKKLAQLENQKWSTKKKGGN